MLRRRFIQGISWEGIRIMNNQFGFVIRYYLAYNLTVKCVEHIQKLKSNNVVQVVIDNASMDSCGKLLTKKYKTDASHALVNHKNLVFSIFAENCFFEEGVTA